MQHDGRSRRSKVEKQPNREAARRKVKTLERAEQLLRSVKTPRVLALAGLAGRLKERRSADI